MNIDRIKYVWKFLYGMYSLKRYRHMFINGASKDTMMFYINEWRWMLGVGPISKCELCECLLWAGKQGYLTKTPRENNGRKLPSSYKFK